MTDATPTPAAAAPDLVEVAPASRAKPLILAAIWAVVGLPILTAAAFGLTSGFSEIVGGNWGMGGGMLLVFLMGWGFSTTGYRRLRYAYEQRFLKAGPGGIEVRIPTGCTFRSAFLGYGMKTYRFSWSQVKNWYEYVSRHNGIPSSSEIRFEGTDGWKLCVPTYHFQGTRGEIAGAIARAAGAKSAA